MRYFFYSAYYETLTKTGHCNLVATSDCFPTMKMLKDTLKKNTVPDANQIVIMGITEISKEDCDTLFSNIND